MTSSGSSFPSSGHYDMLIRGQRALNNVRPTLEKAKKCGVDCSEYEQGLAYLSDTITAFLREYFPDQVVPPSGSGVGTPAE